VIGHAKPDGDAISSVAGLVQVLKNSGIEAQGCIADALPWFYRDIAGAELIVAPEALADRAFDTYVAVDASDLERLGEATALIEGGVPHVTLDHHSTNEGFGELDFCDPSYAATAMIVHDIAAALGKLDGALAQILLLGIATDTGFFRHGNTDARAFAYAAELTRLGARIRPIAQAALEHRTPKAIQLLAKMLASVQFAAEGRIAYGQVSAEMLSATGCAEEDTEGFVGELQAIHAVEAVVLFTEWPAGQVHVSLRSKDRLDVSRVAAAFGGGGHLRAAGCTLQPADVPRAVGRVVPAVVRALVTDVSG